MRRAEYLVLLAGLLVTVKVLAAAEELDRLMEQLAQRTHGHVSFVEEDHVAVLDRPVRSSGELLYDRPDRLEKRTLAPRASSLILDHGSVTIESRGRKRVLALRDYPQIAPFVESLRATLAGDRQALEQVFRVTFEGNLDHWILTLAPLDAKLQGVVQQIRIDGAHDDLRSVSISQADGDDSIMTIGSSMPP